MDVQTILKNKALVLAPMAGVTDSAFRLVCRRYGADLCVTEMVSAKALRLGDKKTARLLTLDEAEGPTAAQLFGADPEDMAWAADWLSQTGRYCAVDINMGCPMPKIVKPGAGSALLRDPDRAAAIVRACVKAIPLPVTVKIRLGWDNEHINAVEVAKRLEAAGAAALCVHGRVQQQYYAPPVNYEEIRRVKEAVSIPVVANGDVDSPEKAKAVLEQTGCDSLMIGRGAMGNPFLFSAIRSYLDTGVLLPPVDNREKLQVAGEHITLMCENKGESVALREARKHMQWYLKGFRGAARLRDEVSRLQTLSDLDTLLQKALCEEPSTKEELR